MLQDLVSVIIPAYNHEKYVQETIQSIINQTYKNIELLIIDDGSKDLTWQKIQELKTECENRFSRVYFLSWKNKGICLTLNQLLDEAQGEYIYLIASDDVAKPNAIEKEVAFLSQNQQYGLVVGNNEIIDSDSQRCYWTKYRTNVYTTKEAKYLTFGDFLRSERKDVKFNSDDFGTYSSLYLGNYIPNGYLIKKEVFNDIRYTPKALSEDYFLMLQISKKYKMKYLDEVLFSYRWHGTNTIMQTEKMAKYNKKTKMYEEYILANIDENSVLPDVLKVKKESALYKKKGIPYIFQIIGDKKANLKLTMIKLLNVIIYKYNKL